MIHIFEFFSSENQYVHILFLLRLTKWNDFNALNVPHNSYFENDSKIVRIYFSISVMRSWWLTVPSEDRFQKKNHYYQTNIYNKVSDILVKQCVFLVFLCVLLYLVLYNLTSGKFQQFWLFFKTIQTFTSGKYKTITSVIVTNL